MRLPAVAACALLVFLPACGNESEAVPRRAVAKAVVSLPSQILGLKVVEENVAGEIRGVSGTYLDSLGLFSFREEDDLLRGTLQVGRFNEVAEPQRRRFRDAIIAQLGSTVPIQLRVGEDDVWLTSGTEQSIFTWFDSQGFYVLSVRSDYAFPRSLLRRLLESQLLR
jgi:hypothetical protein